MAVACLNHLETRIPTSDIDGLPTGIRFEITRRLHQTHQVSQLALAKYLRVGVSKINICFLVHVKKGLIKMQNFSQSNC